jgi:hypothetical protein
VRAASIVVGKIELERELDLRDQHAERNYLSTLIGAVST